jgi:hypothetical protein
MLTENAKCIKERVISSLNPFLNDFNLIFKDLPNRLPIFDAITAEQVEVGEAHQIRSYSSKHLAEYQASL